MKPQPMSVHQRGSMRRQSLCFVSKARSGMCRTTIISSATPFAPVTDPTRRAPRIQYLPDDSNRRGKLYLQLMCRTTIMFTECVTIVGRERLLYLHHDLIHYSTVNCKPGFYYSNLLYFYLSTMNTTCRHDYSQRSCHNQRLCT